MFKKNIKHLQPNLFGLLNTLPESMQKKAKQSKEYAFYNLIFRYIDEQIFSVLFSDVKSRPNAPVNTLVAALILMSHRQWTFEELFNQIHFNILVKLALGLDAIDEIPFSPATIFNFQNRLHKHFTETGENLLEQVFDKLTAKQLKSLKIKTSIQRTDSFAAASNIRNYSRLQLLVELLLRIWRVLDSSDQERFSQQFAPYIKHKSSGQFIYSLSREDFPKELEKLGSLYKWINSHLRPKYKQDVFTVFDRVYDEHFSVIKNKVHLKSNDQMHSGCVQSPDDLDAAYRKKNDVHTKGQTINIVETAHPDNDINLVTDVAVKPVNTNDDVVLNERINVLKEKTPDLNELHSDAAYGSSVNDREFEKHKINHIQTAVKGSKRAVNIKIEKYDSQNETGFTVSCPKQSVKSHKARKRFKACFDYTVCAGCALGSQCPAIPMKKHRVYYFTNDMYLLSERLSRLNSIPSERRFLRNNVEATVKEFTCRMPNKKLKVRGAFKALLFAFSTAMAINYGRIYRMMVSSPDKWAILIQVWLKIFKERWLLQILLRNFLGLNFRAI